jgi:peptidoglycan/LPS O-acetylase OafA/YrhL
MTLDRYRSLDAWRGVACLGVVIFHAGVFGKGWILSLVARGEHGVAMFFVISGYCIAAAADRAHRAQQPLRIFFWRRFRRIFPPFWAFLGLTTALLAAVLVLAPPFVSPAQIPLLFAIEAPGEFGAVALLGNVSLTETWRPHVVGPPVRLLMSHLWTLCYEEQFYAVMGGLLAIGRLGRGVVAVSAAVFLVTQLTPAPALGFFFDGHWLLFAAGAAVFHWRDAPPRRAIIGLLAMTLLCQWRLPWLALPLSVGGCFACALLALRRYDDAIMAHPATSPFVACGLRCYSIYLVHGPVTLLLSAAIASRGWTGSWFTLVVTIPVCLAASLLLAWPFHAYIERRFLNSAPIPLQLRVGNRAVAILDREVA